MADQADLLRALLTDAVHERPCARPARVRVVIVGLDEQRFVAELRREGSRVVDDDGAAVDASLWIAKADVASLLHGFSLNGVRRAGDPAAIEALTALLAPGTSPLGVRSGR